MRAGASTRVAKFLGRILFSGDRVVTWYWIDTCSEKLDVSFSFSMLSVTEGCERGFCNQAVFEPHGLSIGH